MREIKFRAWCEGKHDNMTFSYANMEYGVILSEKGFYLSVESGWDIQGEYPTIPIMQYTGLKDKNGLDCYENDIYKNNESGLIGVMKYHDSLGGYILWAEEKKDGELYNYIPFYELDLTDFEVIGNIYENPELLE